MTRAHAWLAAGLLAVLAAAAAGAIPPLAPASITQDAGCPRDHPALLPTGSREGTFYSRALAGLVVCTSRHGTTTLVSNRTEAVWVLEQPSSIAVHRLPASSLHISFLRLVDSPDFVIPSGMAVVIPRPPSAVQVRIDPALTLAQLAHDQLAGSLALGSRSGRVLDRFGDLLGACLASLLDDVGSPEPVLASGNPAPAIIEAAERRGAAGGVCAAAWRSVGGQSFEEDVASWRRNGGFAVRGMSAAIAYIALTRPAHERR